VVWWAGGQEFRSADDGRVIRFDTYPGFSLNGPWNGALGVTIHPFEGEEIRGALLRRSFVGYSLSATPRNWLPLISVQGEYGGKFDYDAARRGRGGDVTAAFSFRAGDHVAADGTFTRGWLRAASLHLYTADVRRIAATYTPNARASLRLIGQSSTVSRMAAPYRTGNATLSALLIYRLDWQSSVYVGYGDTSVLDGAQRLLRSERSVFMKMSYAVHR